MDTLVALWRAAARTHGAAPLLRFEGRADELTYCDVDARCRALAAQLAACGAGGGRGVLAVALCGGRDGWDVVALLACVVARAPWCPCDAAGAAVVFGLAAPAAAVARAGDVYALAALYATPALIGDALVVAAVDGTVAALDVADGAAFWVADRGAPVLARAGKESDIPNFKGFYLGCFPLVSADFWTSDHHLERCRRVDVFLATRARGTLTLKRR